MLQLKKVHHIAIICKNYDRSKKFYTEVLGLVPIREVYRAERKSYKLDLSLAGQYIIELFSFPNPPARTSQPEATGLRHLAFEVADITAALRALKAQGIRTEELRTDEHTGKLFSFFSDPDGLPLEIYQA